jgi:enediyne biosynthesis protein E4
MTDLTRRQRRTALSALAAIGAVAVALGIGAIGSGRAGQEVAKAGPAPAYLDETASSGLDHTYGGGFPYVASGGLAVFDCDGDGRQDLYLGGGEGPAALFRNDSEVGGALRFTRTPGAETDLTAVNGAFPVNLDGDELVDLIVLRYGENVALQGAGSCRFERANELWSFDGDDDQTQAFSATWEQGSHWPTLAIGNYVQPNEFDLDTRCRPHQLFRPLPPGYDASGVYAEPVPLEPSYCALSMLFSNWSGTGHADLRISNDRAFYRQSDGQEQLWRVEPGQPPLLYDAADGWARVQVEGMGIASHDLTGDGRPEVYLTSQGASRLQTLADAAAGPTYVDIGLPRNVNVAHPFTGADTHLPSTAWHPEFDDVNNDGLIDLFVSKGNVDAQPDYAMEDPSNLLLGQPDGAFAEAADRAGILTFDRGRGAALADFNLDGRLDLVESFYGAPARVWRNTGPAESGDAAQGHWLQLRIRQPAPNVDAIGAVVDVRAGDLLIRRELTIGGGHGGGELGWIHFGLGAATAAEVRVTWPDGEVGSWQAVETDEFTVVDREGGVSRWEP